MKYVYIIVIIFLLTSCSPNTDNVSYVEYTPNNSIRFIRKEGDTSVLINKDEINYLLLLNKENINDIEVNYLIKYKDINTNIKSEEENILNDDITINNIEFDINNKIEIKVEDYNICIYIKELDKDDYSDCNFIYLYNPDKNFYITLNSDLLGLMYHSYTKFNYKFLHHLATVWIETYTIDNDSYVTISLEDDFEVTSDKIRTKTIHKK